MSEKILIIGGGLSGTILAWQLYFNDIDFLLIDNNLKNTSSKIAAGIYNPIVFKRFICSWKADLLIPYLDEFYSKIEEELKTKFHYKIEIHKCFSNNDEINLWKKKSQDFPNNLFMENEILENNNNGIKDTIGFGVVKNSGYLETEVFLEKSHKFFYVKNKLRNYEEKYKYNKITIENDFPDVSKVIFAEGYFASQNEFFPNLRFNFAKGELLEVIIQDFEVNYIISKNLFVFPKGNNKFLVGSTFDWTFEDEIPTEIKRDELIVLLNKVISNKSIIIDHKAGIRPATFDRRPFVGKSEVQDNYYIFNGMGAKAVLLAPYCSSILFDNLFNNKEIPYEINTIRCKKLNQND
jgi:glycine/D-amino acid oxidase-like deaminating enzyme